MFLKFSLPSFYRKCFPQKYFFLFVYFSLFWRFSLAFIFKSEILTSCLETLYIGDLIIGDSARNEPFCKSPVDVNICRSFVPKQVSLTENNLPILYLGVGVCVFGRCGRGTST